MLIFRKGQKSSFEQVLQEFKSRVTACSSYIPNCDEKAFKGGRFVNRSLIMLHKKAVFTRKI